MDRNLDPRLQSIIENSSKEAYSSDTFHSSVILEDEVHPTLSRHSSSCRQREGFNFLPAGEPQNDFVLDNFDRSVLQSDNSRRQLESKNSHEIFSTAPATIHSGPWSTIVNNQTQFKRHHPQRQPINQASHLNYHRLTTQTKRQQHRRPAVPEPTAAFYCITRSDLSQPQSKEPVTPFNLGAYSYTPPERTAPIAFSTHQLSSPSNRISLRRMSSRPRPPTTPQELQLFPDEKILPYTPPHQRTPSFLKGAGPASDRHRNTPTAHGIQLVSPHQLPDMFRQVFPYQLFNAVQSKCFESVYQTGDNVVISAPTGSGKTAILELAICKLVHDFSSGQFKIVYQAPTKSLCVERVRDWQRKFSHLNLPCAELTGDTDSSEMRKVGNAAIIVTTPEKWDSITRKWKDYIKLLQMVKLFLIDEVHILKDVRGATLEAVVSRMKSIGASVRFVALSATVPNSQDIATWLGKDHTNSHLPAHRETFGEDFRPVKLQKHVYGFGSTLNDFAFDSILDTKLPTLVAKHTKGKPVMVFCFTRKSCENTAAKLADWWVNLRVTDRPWPIPSQRVAVGNKELRELVGHGVAFHHAGLDVQDRAAVEASFLNKGGISVICCTSTLAVGVNLPCHLVVIKNTVGYSDGGLAEYSDLEVMQMLGRAGRPQFDDSAIAIIMTRSEKVDRYKKMMSGQDVLESTLHLNLIEHLNSEISLGTVHDVHSAKRWLAGTFLSVRMRQNPSYYKFSSDTGTRDADERLERICERDIELLQNTKLISDDQRFHCTDYGEAMSKYMVQFETMKLILSVPKHAKMTQILHVVSQAAEFKDLRLKPNERACFREFNKSPFIKSPIRDNVTTYAHKVSLIIQIHLGGAELPMDKEFGIIRRQFLVDTAIVFDRVQRLLRCVVECKAYDCDAIATCNALELARSVSAGFWENSALQLRQIPNIGPAAVRKLVQSDVKTVRQLASMDTSAIERVLSRNPPFGRKILDSIADFPRLALTATIVKKVLRDGWPVKVQIKACLGLSNAKIPFWNRRLSTLTFTAAVSSGSLAHIWRGPIKRVEKGHEIAFTCELLCPNDTIACELACEEIVGTIQSVLLKPDILASAFPTPKPIPAVAESTLHDDGKGLEQDADQESLFLTVVEGDKDSAGTSEGSYYGGDSVFDDFMDIDSFDKNVGMDDNETGSPASEPVRMENGKWRCNHKCSDGQGTKTGQPCKHHCCREGLDKPRKVAKKKLTVGDGSQKEAKSKQNQQSPPKITKKSSLYNKTKPKLKLAMHEMPLNNIEELDLVDQLSPECDDILPQYYKTESSNSDFPSPSELLGGENSLDYDQRGDMRLFPVSSYEQSDLPKVRNGTLHLTASFENGVFDFKAFQSDPQMQPSSEKRRSPPTSPIEPQAKYPRVSKEEKVTVETKPMPEWVNGKDIDQELVAYFEGCVDFV